MMSDEQFTAEVLKQAAAPLGSVPEVPTGRNRRNLATALLSFADALNDLGTSFIDDPPVVARLVLLNRDVLKLIQSLREAEAA